MPAEVLLDNARALVEHHDAATREVRFNGRLHAFARYLGFKPRACAPYRARTKGKDERGVAYVKRNAIAGRRFPSWGAFVADLERWTREIADQRVHGTTGEPPIARFAAEACSAAIWVSCRIASPEMLPDVEPLPHLKCSPAGGRQGDRDGAGEHGDT